MPEVLLVLSRRALTEIPALLERARHQVLFFSVRAKRHCDG
jgi:hypothetical protein